jgi:hypothetical protein
VQQYNRTKDDADGPATTLHCFRRDPRSKLLFFVEGDSERVCIPKGCFQKVFSMVHDNRAHIGADRIYYLLRPHIYIPRLYQQILQYSSHCPICRQAKPKRAHPWGSLQPIDHPEKPLAVLSFDFVEGLPSPNKAMTRSCTSHAKPPSTYTTSSEKRLSPRKTGQNYTSTTSTMTGDFRILLSPTVTQSLLPLSGQGFSSSPVRS